MNYPQPAYEFSADDFDADSMGQDVTDPIWPSAAVEPDVGLSLQHHKGSDNFPGEVRTAHGVLDMLGHVVEEIIGVDDGRVEKPLGVQHHRGPTVDTYSRVADSFRMSTFDVGTSNNGQGIRIAQSREARLRCVVTNWGPGILYVGHDTGSNAAAPMATGQIAVGGNREFRHCDEIWAWPAVPNTSQVCDVQDEYGYPQ